MEPTSVKYNNLIQHLKSFKNLAIAFSGGVDSSLLLYLAKRALGNDVMAFTVNTPYIPRWEIEEAENFAMKYGVLHKIIEFPFIAELKENPKDRCYICKKHLFTFLKQEAQKAGFEYLADGTNFDDTKDYRPGMIALKELGIASPFLETGTTKADIRKYSQQLELPTWEKPAYACLLTRLPYGQVIKNGELKRIEQAERFLFSLGFEGCRVRMHENMARIEIKQEHFGKMLNIALFQSIASQLKEMGFSFVTLDMEGYKMGSFNKIDS